MLMSEVEREQIISARLDERQKQVDRLNLSNLIKSQRKRPESPEDDKVVSSKRRFGVFSVIGFPDQWY